MRRPPCAKCGGTNLFLDLPRLSQEQAYLVCYTCGWRIYGDEAIEKYVRSYNEDLSHREEEARVAKLRSEEEQRRAEAKAEALRQEAAEVERALQLETLKQAQEQVYLIPEQGVQFRVGDMHPTLLLPWALPVPNREGEEFHPCAWPPCEQRARPKSVYCSRKCCVRVAHRRDKLRKKKLLKEEKQAS